MDEIYLVSEKLESSQHRFKRGRQPLCSSHSFFAFLGAKIFNGKILAKHGRQMAVPGTKIPKSENQYNDLSQGKGPTDSKLQSRRRRWRPPQVLKEPLEEALLGRK